MTISLRKRKQSKHGKISLFLEIYKGRTTTADGKTKYIREYEFLNLFLIDNPKTESDKIRNKEILQLAKSLKNKREVELQSGLYGFQTTSKNTNFYQYYYDFVEKKKNTSSYLNLCGTLNTFKGYAGEHITFNEITEGFCSKYLEYLLNKTSLRHKKLATSTAKKYFDIFGAVILQAIQEKIIRDNPLFSIKSIKVKQTEKVYLTLEELKLLVKTDCKQPILKRAFIFSCLTGLRWSDVYKLKWSEIQGDEGKYRLEYRQKKTQELNYLPLPDQAVSYLGKRGLRNDKVFSLCDYG
jgi:hypothetical protein